MSEQRNVCASPLVAADRPRCVLAVFFSVFFVWQLVAAPVGLGGGEDLVDVGDAEPEAAEDVHPPPA